MTTTPQEDYKVLNKNSKRTTLHEDTRRSPEFSSTTFNNFQNPIDLTKEIKYFKVLVDVDDQYRSNLIRTLERVNKGYLNLVYSLIKGHILLTNLELEKQFKDKKEGAEEKRDQKIKDRERLNDFSE